jgi:hypothetical protein
MSTFDNVVTNPASGGAYFATVQYTDGPNTINLPVTALVYGPTSGPHTIVDSSTPLPIELLKIGGSAIDLGQETKANSIPVTLASDNTVTITGTVTSNIGTTNGLALESSLSKLPVLPTSSSSGIYNVISGGVVTTSAPTYTNNTTNSLSLTPTGALRTDGSSVTQPISGTVAASQSGAWNITNITGTVSLPTGASTLTEQQTQTTSLQLLDDVVVTSGTSSSSKAVSVAGNDGTSHRTLKTDSSGVLSTNVLTLPAIPAGSNIIGSVMQSGTWNVGQTGTWTVDIGTAPTLIVDGSGVTQPVSGTLTANIGTTGGLALDATVDKLNVAQGAAVGSNTGPLVQGIVKTSAPSYTNNTINPVSITASGALRTDSSATTQPVSGTVSASQSGSWNVTDITGTVTLPTGASTLAEQQSQTTSLQLLDDTVVTVGSVKGNYVAATDGTNPKIIKCDSSGVLSTNVLTIPAIPAGSNVIGAVTQSGSWNVGQTGTWTTQINQGGNTAIVSAAGALKVDGSAVTQPISGTVAASQSGTWNINNITGSITLPTGASLLSEQQTHTTSLQLLDDVVGTVGSASPSKAYLVGGSDGTNIRALSVNSSGQVGISDGGNSITVDNSGTFAVQAAQAGSWAVTVSSGSVVVSDGGGSITVDGTVGVSGTVAISASSLPLPTGASTSAKQPALGTAGSASTDVLTVQGITSMTPLVVDGSGVTQPVSGTITASDGGGSLTVDAPVGTPVFVRLSDGTSAISTLPVSVASVPTHAVTQSGTWTVQPGNTANTTPWLTTISQGGNSATVSAGGALKVDNSGVTQPVSGPLTDSQLRATPVDVSVTSFTGNNTVEGIVAHDSAVSTTKPILLGAYGSSTAPTAVSAAGDLTRIWCDLNGRVQIGDGGSTISIDDGGGSITVDGTVAVTGTFWQATQPVSIASPVAVTGPLTDTELRASAVAVSLASVPSHQVTNAGTFAVQASQSGTWTVQPGNTPNTSPWLFSIHDGTTKAEVVPLSSYNAIATAIVDGSGNQITSFGGGSQYTEDQASAGGESLTLAGAVRRDTAASSSGTDGDYSTINTDSTGCLWARVKTIDGGGVASGASDSGNPVKIGGKYNSTLPTLTDGYRGDLQLDSRARVRVSAEQQTSGTASWTSATGTATLKIATGGCSHVFFAWYSSGSGPTVEFGVSQDNTVAYALSTVYSPNLGTWGSGTKSLAGSDSVMIPTFGAAYVHVRITIAVGSGTTDVYYGSSDAFANANITKVSNTVTVDSELPAATTLANAMANPTTPLIGSCGARHNGSTWDLEQSKETGTLITYAAYTTTQSTSGSPITSRTAKGAIVYVRVGAVGTGTLTLNLCALDPLGNGLVVAATNVTGGVATYQASWHPGASGTGNGIILAASHPLNRQWYVVLSKSDGSSWTFGVTYELSV